MARRDLKDMTGIRIGTRVIIAYAGAKRWLVRCDCGREVSLQGADLRRGKGGLGCVCPATDLARFSASCLQVGGCLIWQASKTDDGYGAFKVGGQVALAHKWNWERTKGQVPTGRELDHLCRVRACVLPAHLEPVTHAENVRRGELAAVTRLRHLRAKGAA